MYRSLSPRLAAVLAMLAFLLNVAGESVGLHVCEHHSASHGAPGSAAGEAHHGEHGHTHANAGSHGAPEHSDEHSGPCTCIGACQVGGTAALPAADVAWSRAPGVRRETPSPPVTRDGWGTLLPYILPYGQAPPQLG